MTYINNTTVPTDGLVASYDLDGSADDSSGNGNNGTATNITWVGAERGYVEEMASFNGSSSGITGLTNVLNVSGDFTISQWVKYNSFNGGITYVRTNSSGNGIIGKTAFTNNAGFSIHTGTWNDLEQSSPQIGKWYHQVLVREGTTAKLYINGVLDKSVSIGNNITNGTNISTYGQYFSDRLNGYVGLLKQYNKALSQDEIDNLYQEGLRKLGPTNAPLSGNFPKYSLPNLEEGKVLEISRPQSGGSYIDQTGNGNNGTPTNVTDSSNGLNNVMTFNGSSSFVSTTFSPSNLQNGFTAELYLNPNDINSTQIAFQQFSGSGAFWDYLINAGSFTLRTFQTSNGDIVAPIETGKWQQFIFTINGTELKLYKDGVLIGTTTTNLQNPTGSVEIGRNVFGGGGNYFNGQISNPRICNRALSETEIKEQYYSNKII